MTLIKVTSSLLIHTAPSPTSGVHHGLRIGDIIFTSHPKQSDGFYSDWFRLMTKDEQWLATRLEGHVHAEILD